MSKWKDIVLLNKGEQLIVSASNGNHSGSAIFNYLDLQRLMEYMNTEEVIDYVKESALDVLTYIGSIEGEVKYSFKIKKFVMGEISRYAINK